MTHVSGSPPLGLSAPSDWVRRWAHLAQPSQSILDVACGAGRHSKLFADKGCAVTAIDVSGEALQVVQAHSPGVRIVQADIESGVWPLMQNDSPQLFDAVVVTHYLHRPLFPVLLGSLAQGGVLIYETFAIGNEAFGRPSRPDFLLQPAELLTVCKDMHIVAYEDGFLPSPNRCVQRIVACKQGTHSPTKMQPLRHLL